MVPLDVSGNNPSTESLQTITYMTECVAPHDPNLLKSQQSSPNHLVACVSISRTSSFNSGSSNKNLAVPTDVLAVPCAKNTALAATNNTLLTADIDINNKLSPQPYTGE